MAIAEYFLEQFIDDISDTSLRLTELEHWLMDRKQNDKRMILGNFPETLIKSIFLALVANMDSCLSEVTNSLYSQYHLNIAPDDLRGKGIQRSINYLKKVALIPIPDDLKTYEDVLQLIKLRNHYAHDGKPIVLKDSTIHKSASKFESIEIYKSITNRHGEHVSIYLTFDFLRDACLIIRTFIHELYDLVENKYKVATTIE